MEMGGFTKLKEDAPELPSTHLPDATKIDLFLDAAASKAGEINPGMARCLSVSKPFVILPIRVLMCLVPFYMWLFRWCIKIYAVLPTNIIQAIFGIALCFFGGTYVASIAAIEAFRQMGWQKVYVEIKVVYDQLQNVRSAYDKEAAKDADNDGTPDLQQMTPDALAKHLALVAMGSISEPGRLQTAVGSLWTSYIAVLATLRLEFARTTAFALGIVEMVKFPFVRTLSPLVLAALAGSLGPDASKAWSVTLVESSLTLIAVAVAWYLQMIISAFYSGLRGGRMFADAICTILIENGWMEKLPCIKQPFDASETYLDEVIGYTLAAFGFGFQFFSGFQLSFPLNIIFLPLTIIEWFLRIQISMTDGVAH